MASAASYEPEAVNRFFAFADLLGSLKYFRFNCKKVDYLTKNNILNSFGFNALRHQHDQVRHNGHQTGLGNAPKRPERPDGGIQHGAASVGAALLRVYAGAGKR